MREKIFHLIDVPEDKRKNDIYDWVLFAVTLISIVPLMFQEELVVFRYIEYFALFSFVVDYVLRFACADLILPKKTKITSFLVYPFTFMAIVDLLSIVSLIGILNSNLHLLKILRLLQIIRVFKLLRYSNTVGMIINVFQKQKEALWAVGSFAVAYIFLSALIIFNVEPETFSSFFDAVYWATVSLTTVGYGDIYPVTSIGRCVAMFSSIFGIAIVALPAGIISAGYMDELREKKEQEKL